MFAFLKYLDCVLLLAWLHIYPHDLISTGPSQPRDVTLGKLIAAVEQMDPWNKIFHRFNEAETEMHIDAAIQMAFTPSTRLCHINIEMAFISNMPYASKKHQAQIHIHWAGMRFSIIILMEYSNLSPLAGTSVFNNIYSRFYERARGHFQKVKSSLWSGRVLRKDFFFTTVHALGGVTVDHD